MAKKRKTSPLNFYGYREQEDFEPQNNITEAIDNVKKEQKKTDTSQDEEIDSLQGQVKGIEDTLSATTKALGELSGKAFTYVEYDDSGKTINFFNEGGDNVGSIDATLFVKDGMIDNVSYDPSTKVLTIVFNTDAGKETISINLEDLFNVESGDGIEVNGNKVSIKIDTGSTDARFITLSEDGLGLSGITEAIEENIFWEKPSEEEQQEGVYTVLNSPNGTPLIKITNEGELFIIVEGEMVSVNDLLGQIAHEEY